MGVGVGFGVGHAVGVGDAVGEGVTPCSDADAAPEGELEAEHEATNTSISPNANIERLGQTTCGRTRAALVEEFTGYPFQVSTTSVIARPALARPYSPPS